MPDSLILPGFDQRIEKPFTICFSESNRRVPSNSIGVDLYARALTGYQCFAQTVGKSILKTDIELFVEAEVVGSFLSKLKAIGSAVGQISALMGILSFFGISAQDIPTAYIKVKAAIISTIKENKGNIGNIVDNINKSRKLDDLDKAILIKLFNNEDTRDSLDKFTSPLDSKNFNKITISADNHELVSINSSDREYFIYISPRDEKTEPFEDVVEILYISPEYTRWQFKGKTIFWAEILDTNFLQTTRNKKSTELKGKRYFARGRKISVRKQGGTNWSSQWFIDSIEDENNQNQLI